MTSIAVLIDGGFVRSAATKDDKVYEPKFIEKFGLSCKGKDEVIHRILYYDCAPCLSKTKLPVSGANHQFAGNDQWLHDLARKDYFAVRRGVLKFRGWEPKNVPMAAKPTDADFVPRFEQKGVDMRIGLDMANYAANRAVGLLVLVTNDTDCIPAMKYARRAGLQVALVSLPNRSTTPELMAHCDFLRKVEWP